MSDKMFFQKWKCSKCGNAYFELMDEKQSDCPLCDGKSVLIKKLEESK